MNRLTRVAVACVLVVGLSATAGCIRRTPRVQSDVTTGNRSTTLPMNDADNLDVTLEMGAGELSVSSDDIVPDALRGRFEYSPEALAPDVEGKTEASTTVVTVANLDGFELSLSDAKMENTWEISLPTSVPTALTVRIGAGEGNLDLRGIALDSLAIEQGTGDVNVDLSEQARDLMAQATLGAGEVTIKLPSDVGVRVRGFEDGLGGWESPGFTKRGGALVNDAYGKPGVPTIDLDVQRGLGGVVLELVP